MYRATILADSVSGGDYRLTTMEVVFPRIVLSEFNTHRVFSRNSASSRAIPIAKQLESIEQSPFIPDYWGANQSGMQAERPLATEAAEAAKAAWLQARDNALQNARRLLDIGLHKQLANRLLEPFMWQTVIVSSTEWENFFALRAAPDAQPEIRRIAELMKDAYRESIPLKLADGEWHLPLLQDDEREWATEHLDKAVKVCCGRSARVSYLTHDGKRDHDKDLELYQRLIEGGHMSPLEHVARPMTPGELAEGQWSGNFHGWHQHRKDVAHEDNFAEVKEK